MSKYAAYFSIESKIKGLGFQVDRSDLIDEYTNGNKNSLRDLSEWEYKEFIKWLNPILQNLQTLKKKDWQNSPENRMRRKIIALFVHRMDYTLEDLDYWCEKFGKFKKKLNDHSLEELSQLVTQAEKVYESFIKSVNK